MQPTQIDYAYYTKRVSGSAIACAPLADVWAIVTAIGANNGYYYLDIL